MNLLKRLILLSVCGFFIVSVPPATIADTAGNDGAKRELVFLNWAEYIDPEVVAEFEKQHKARLRQVFFETDDTRDELLVETGGKGYDLVLSSGLALNVYRKQGWLAPVTARQAPNLRHIKPRWLKAFPGADGYAVPYFWGSTGVAYRRDLLGYDITSWRQLFQPDARLSGRILMTNTVNELVGAALKALGYSINSTDPEHYRQAEQLLQQQKEHVKEYGYMSLNEESALVKGDFYAAMTYNGDALAVKDIEPQIQYVLPKEGGLLWVDYIVIMSSSNNKQLAYQFVDFLNQPEIAARLAEFTHSASPNSAAEKLLDRDFLSDPLIYPGDQALQRSEFNRELPARIQRTRNTIFNNLTRQ